MADLASCPPLTRQSVEAAHELIKPYIHRTPVLTCTVLNTIASTPQSPSALKGTEFEGHEPAKPKFNFFFKCENFQRIGAFKARGAFHALARLGEEGRKHGVVTHSSGNHAQALALAAKTFDVPAHIVMPRISTPSKIAGTQGLGASVYFSGSTEPEREAVVAQVQRDTPGVVLVPPYNHPDVMLGQGTLALELEAQAAELLGGGGKLDAVIGPIGGGGMLSGVATALYGTGVQVFGAEPSFEGADDARRGIAAGERVASVSTLTIADGLRTPVGTIPWTVVADPAKVRRVFAVSEDEIRAALQLVLERMKVVVEPSAAVPLAACLFNEELRRIVADEGGDEGWNVGIILTGGNTTVAAIAKLFGEQQSEEMKQREAGSKQNEEDKK